MSFEQPLERVGLFPADIDMSNEAVWQFAPVWLAAGSNTANYAVSAGGAALVAQGGLSTPAYGILQNAPVVGEPGAVVTAGITKCIVITAITVVGNPIKLVAGGCAPSTATGDHIDGVALETGAAGTIVAIHLQANGLHA